MEKRHYDREIETMTRAELLAFQWRELKRQIDYAYARSGLCQRQFQKARISPDDIKTWADFRNKVPFTTKQDMVADQQEKPPYGTRLAVPEEDISLTFLTSGTSGKGQEVHAHTKEDCEVLFDMQAMWYTWGGWRRGDRHMNPLPLSMAAASSCHPHSLERVGCHIFNFGMFDTKLKLEYMKRFHINCLFSVPAYLETLTTEAEGLGLEPARDLSVRKIFIAVGAWPVSFVRKMQEKWNAKIYDYYGSTQWAEGATCENGALVGDQRGYYHLCEHIAVHEVLNPETGEPVGPGEVGEMVVTPLLLKAIPYLRFRMFDRVRYFPHTACDCGRPFALLEAGTIGRYDDMMKIKGVNIWPETIDELVLTKTEVAEYRGLVYISPDSREKAEVAIEFKPGIAEDLKARLMARLADEIRDKTGIGFEVKETPEKLPRAVFKVRRWTDERVKGLERKSS